MRELPFTVMVIAPLCESPQSPFVSRITETVNAAVVGLMVKVPRSMPGWPVASGVPIAPPVPACARKYFPSRMKVITPGSSAANHAPTMPHIEEADAAPLHSTPAASADNHCLFTTSPFFEQHAAAHFACAKSSQVFGHLSSRW